jgi:exopolysaccharide biosynthesis polyprenyl glycosylphosphotransferase
MYRRRHRKAKLLFALSDLALVAIAFQGAYYFRQSLGLEREFYIEGPLRILLLGFCFLAWTGSAIWLNLYEKLQTGSLLLIVRGTFQQCAAATTLLILFQYFLRLNLSRPFLFLFVVLAWALLLLFRVFSGNLVGAIRKRFSVAHHVLIAGQGMRARRVADAIEHAAEPGVKLIGFLRPGLGDELLDLGEAAERYQVFPLQDLPRLLEESIIDEIVFAVDSRALSELEDIFLLCDEEGVRTRVPVDFFPHLNSEIYLDHLHNLPVLTFSAAPDDEIRLFVKRVTDAVLAGSALLLLLPVMGAVTALIKATSAGPAIFRQVRCGLNGRRFVLYKFRSMCAGAEEMKAALAHLNQKQTAFKIENDPRLTPVGRVLRKFSIDEWPQLWNVLKGDMSLVGPRPAVPEEVEQYKRWQRRRLRMRPGLTCLWALAGRDRLDFEAWMKKDLEYIDNWSLALDWKIILRTIPHVLTGKGAN